MYASLTWGTFTEHENSPWYLPLRSSAIFSPYGCGWPTLLDGGEYLPTDREKNQTISFFAAD
jgi:hypothetical protein